MVAMQIDGPEARSLSEAFRTAPDHHRRRLRAAMAEAGREARQDAERRAPGSIGRTITVRIEESGDTIRALLVAAHPASHFQEWGTGTFSEDPRSSHQEYTIRPRRKRALRFAAGGGRRGRRGGREVFARSVVHPGVRPRRFMRGALASQRNRMRGRIDRAVRLAQQDTNARIR